MKVNYLPKNRLRRPYLRRILVLVAIFISGAVVFSFFDAAIISIVSPIWKAKNIITGSEIPSILKEQTQENILLELIGRKQKANMVVASVLTSPPKKIGRTTVL